MDYQQTKIKRATKDYFCEKCHTIIPCGTDYVDCSVKTDNGWMHKRYHKDCDNVVTTGVDVVDNVFTRLKKEGPFIMANKGNKCIVQGIVYDHNGNPFIVCRTWEEKAVYYETIENFKGYIDYKGDTL